jgi:hypothetical protein
MAESVDASFRFLRRQVRQDLVADLVLAERRFILTKGRGLEATARYQ